MHGKLNFKPIRAAAGSRGFLAAACLSYIALVTLWSFTPYLKVISFINPFLHSSFLFLPNCLHGSWSCIELSGHWRLSVLVSSFSYFFLATCARLSWSLSFWVQVKLFFRIILMEDRSVDKIFGFVVEILLTIVVPDMEFEELKFESTRICWPLWECYSMVCGFELKWWESHCGL